VSMQKTPLLIVTSRPADLEELAPILQGTPWELTDASHVEDPLASLKAAAVPILLFDRDTAGASWQVTMQRLVKSRRGACVVLLSNVSDQYLWEEVVQNGGFDLLARPFRREQVLSTLMFAYARCRMPWPRTGG
jgi:FixJ family two-component response regulator